MNAAALEAEFGHPQEMWEALAERVQVEHVKLFSEVCAEWLDLMWTLDAYRRAGVAPLEMGDPAKSEGKRLAAAYRGKGNWFATLLTLLLENQTTRVLAPRVRVQGFSQTHQIDVAWPDREVDPLICLETKVTGAPASESDPVRGAMADWTNRRKELKFAATDLKLFRRQQLTSIRHWDTWRESTFPKAYFLWAARLGPKDSVARMVAESQALVKTYLDGAGIVAWQERADGDGYEAVPIPPADRVSDVDDVLYRISSEIKDLAPPGQDAPPPELPPSRVLDPTALDPE